MTDEKPGSAEMAKIKQVDAALKQREKQLEHLQQAIQEAKTQNEIDTEFPREHYKAVITVLNTKIGKVNARIKRLNELRKERHTRYEIAVGNAVIPSLRAWQDNPKWGQWSPEIGDDGVEE